MRQPAPTRLWSAWVVFTVFCAVGCVGYFGPASLVSEDARSVLYTGTAAASAIAIVVAIRRHRPAGWRAWALLAASQTLYVCGDATWFVLHRMGLEPYPGLPDVFYLAAYPTIIMAVTMLVRRRTPSWHLPTAIDASIMGTAAALLWWVYVLGPLALAPELSLPNRLVTAAYPVMDLLVLIVALRLMLGHGRRVPAYHLLVGSLAVMLVGDGLYAVQNAAGTWEDYGWVDATWLTSYIMLGAAALHPTVRRLDRPLEVAIPDAGPGRVAMLAVAALVAPAVMIAEYVRGRPPQVPVVAFACAVMFLLVLARMAGLLAVQRREAITDVLTGTYTRRFFEENLRVEIERSRRSGEPLGMLLIDADHFKNVNDSHGHLAGDRVLAEVARRVRETSRPGDILARFGGEEFAVLMPGTGPDLLDPLAERVRRIVSATPVPIGNGWLPVTVSVGAASVGAERSGADLVEAADRALYVAKGAGRNRIAVAEPLGSAS